MYFVCGAEPQRGDSPLTGRQLFQHRLSGVRELRRRFAPNGRGVFSAPAERGTRTASACSPLTGGSFSAPTERGTRTALACSPLTGGSFFAEPQRGVALCGARETAAPAAGAKRKGHLRFPFLFELLPFPCLLARRKSESGDRFENGVRQRIFPLLRTDYLRCPSS